MGDPAGIGPEIIAKALSRASVHDICRPIVIGDAGIMRRAVKIAHSELNIHPVAEVSQAKFSTEAIDVFSLPGIELKELQLGVISAEAGNAAFVAVKTMIELALARAIDATVTAPIHKEALARAGHQFPDTPRFSAILLEHATSR